MPQATKAVIAPGSLEPYISSCVALAQENLRRFSSLAEIAARERKTLARRIPVGRRRSPHFPASPGSGFFYSISCPRPGSLPRLTQQCSLTIWGSHDNLI